MVVYYESMKRKLKIKPIYECRDSLPIFVSNIVTLFHNILEEKDLLWLKITEEQCPHC
jgi:hypothetical protein